MSSLAIEYSPDVSLKRLAYKLLMVIGLTIFSTSNALAMCMPIPGEVPYTGDCTASQIDDDEDGVPLSLDRCLATPITVPATAVDAEGCALDGSESKMYLSDYEVTDIEFNFGGAQTYFSPYPYNSPVVTPTESLIQAFYYNSKNEIRVYEIDPATAVAGVIPVNPAAPLFRIKGNKLVIWGNPVGPINVKYEGVDAQYVYVSPINITGTFRCDYTVDNCDYNVAFGNTPPTNYRKDGGIYGSWLSGYWILSPELGSLTYDYTTNVTHITAGNTGTTTVHNIVMNHNTGVLANNPLASDLNPSSLNPWTYGFAGTADNPIVFGWEENDNSVASASSIDALNNVTSKASIDLNAPSAVDGQTFFEKFPNADSFFPVAANEFYVIGWINIPVDNSFDSFLDTLAACEISSTILSPIPVAGLSCERWISVPGAPSEGLTNVDNITARLSLGLTGKIYAGAYENYTTGQSADPARSALFVLDLDAADIDNATWIPVGALTNGNTSELISGVVADNGMLIVAERFLADGVTPVNSSHYESYKLLKPTDCDPGTKISTFTFPDPALKQCVVNTGARRVGEVTSLDCSGQGVTDASGIEQLCLISDLDLSDNALSSFIGSNKLKELSSLNLESAFADQPALGSSFGAQPGTVVDVTALPALTDLSVKYLQNVASIDLSGSPLLRSFNASYSSLQAPDFSLLPLLEELDFYNAENDLGDLDFSNNPELRDVSVAWSGVTRVVFNDNANLERFDASNNSFNSIDDFRIDFAPAITHPNFYDVAGNPFTVIDLSRAGIETVCGRYPPYRSNWFYRYFIRPALIAAWNGCSVLYAIDEVSRFGLAIDYYSGIENAEGSQATVNQFYLPTPPDNNP